MAQIDDDSLDMPPAHAGQGLKRAIKELAWNKTISTFAGAMFALFSPVYLYQEGVPVWMIVAAFTVAYAARIVVMPWIGMTVARIGFERSIGVSVVCVLIYYVLMALVPHAAWCTWAAMIVFQLYLGFYWTGFHGNLGRYGDKSSRGKEYSIMSVLTLLAAAAGPLVGGLLIESVSFFWLLVVIGVLQIVSVVPLFTTREIVCVESMRYGDAWRLLRRPALRRFAVGLMGLGEEIVLITIWPIYVFLLVSDYVTFGAISTFVTIATGALMWLAGRWVDAYRARRAKERAQDTHTHDVYERAPWFQRLGSIAVTGAWILRSVASTAVQVFALDAGAKSAKSMISVSYVARAYDMTSDADRLAFVVLWQQAIALGKLIAGLVVVAVLLVTGGSLQAAFWPAVVVSLLLLLL